MSENNATSSQKELFSKVGTPKQFRWLHGIVKAVIVLNVLDAIFTLLWVQTGLANEANVLLQDLVSNHTVLFMVVKLVLVSLGSILLWRYRKHPFAVAGLFLVFLAYYSILLYHLSFLRLLKGFLKGN
jgi:hypothetical protein